jgi:K+-sensing histidine kinase KdpD
MLDHKWAGYVVAASSVGLLTLVLKIIGSHVNAATVSLALLLNVLFIATRWGSWPALLASILAMLCFNFFFLPSFGTLTIAPLITDRTARFSHYRHHCRTLSGRAKRRAEEAEMGSREIERLYAKLRDAFQRASHAEALRQSEKLKSALLDAVTHDLRTPLTSIKASITTLLDEVRGGEPPATLDRDSRVEMMEVIDEESDRLSRFINGLIELAQIEAGELQLRRRWGAVDEIISTALQRAEPI